MSTPESPEESPVNDSRGSSKYQPPLSIALALVLVLVVAVFGIGHSFQKKNSSSAVNSPGNTNTSSTIPSVNKGLVVIQVANGTNVKGLASTYSNRLITLGWNSLQPVNYPNLVSTSRIYYRKSYQTAAYQIAAEIGAPPSDVAPMPATLPLMGTNADNIVVIVGPNLAG